MDRRVVIAMQGGIASGKSTLARELARRLDLPLISADGVRSALGLGAAFGDPQHELGRPGGAHADPPHEIYAEVMRRADRLLGAGWGVVLDGCFGRRAQCEAARAVAQRHGVPFLLVECRVPESIRRERLSARDARDGLAPGSWLELARSFDSRRERIDGLPPAEYLVVDASLPPGAQVEGPLRARLEALGRRGPEGAKRVGHVPMPGAHREAGAA